MTYIIAKHTKSNPNKLIANRLHIKAFNNANDLGAFLSKQPNNDWQEVSAAKKEAHSYPTKSGQYAFAGGAWHNVRRMDAGVLAHI